MSTTQLPRRPYVQLSPPDGGLDDVRRGARVRRRRRTIAVAALGSGVATTVTVLALLGGSDGLAVLKTNVPPAGGTTPPAVSQVTGVATPSAHSHGVVAPQPAGAGTQQTGAGTQQSSRVAGAPQTGKAQGTSSNSSPQMSRYKSTRSRPPVCEAGSVNSNVYSNVDWCLYPVVARSGDSTRLTMQLCRAAAGSGSLTFGTTNEADIAVQRNGKTIWDWARAHPARTSSHSLTLAQRECWNWSLLWPDVTQTGTSAGTGSFTFVATTYAEELSGYPTTTKDFTV
jgi:hypothetical protein